QADAGIAVLQLFSGLEAGRRLIAGDGKRVVRRRVPFPEVAFPSGQFFVRQAGLLGVVQTRGVRTELADGNAPLAGVVLPLRDELAGPVVEGDAAVRDGNAQREPGDE